MRRNGRRVARRRSPGRSHHDADQRRSLIHPPIAPSRHRAIASSRHRVIAPLIARLFDTSTLVEAIHRHRHGTSRPTRCTRTQWGVLSTPWAARASRAAPACRRQPRAGCVGTGCRPGSGRQPPRPPRRSRRRPQVEMADHETQTTPLSFSDFMRSPCGDKQGIHVIQLYRTTHDALDAPSGSLDDTDSATDRSISLSPPVSPYTLRRPLCSSATPAPSSTRSASSINVRRMIR